MFQKSCLLPLLVLGLLTAPLAEAAPPPLEPRLVKDIATGSDAIGYVTSQNNRLAAAGNRVFFTQKRADTGEELWVSEGTPKSSRLVKDIYPGITSSQIKEMVTSGNKVFFTAHDGLHGWEVWVSDGTEAGTRLVKDLLADQNSERVPYALYAFNDGIAFAAHGDSGLLSLWWTDGTADNTRLLKQLVRDADSDWAVNERRWAVWGAHLYFGTQEGDPGGQDTGLWRTDGTVEGTARVRLFPNAGRDPVMAGIVGSTLYFNVLGAGTGYQLWKTDGTEAGTELTRSFSGNLGDPAISDIVAIGSKGYFRGGFSLGGVWETDGTAEGTKKILETTEKVLYLLAVENKLWLSTQGHGSGQPSEVLLLNPATLETTPLGAASGNVERALSNGHQVWYAKYYPGTSLYKMWIFDGQTEKDLGLSAEFMSFYTATAEGFFFSAQQGVSPWVWKVPAQAPFKPVRLSPAYTLPASSSPRNFVKAGTVQFFTATTAANGEELWATNGTETGTRMVKDIFPGATGSQPCSLISGHDGILYFGALTPDNMNGLWRSDGTTAGTWKVKNISSSPSQNGPNHLIVYGSRIFFVVDDQIWTSRGSAGGADTLPLGDLRAQVFSSDVREGAMVWPSVVFGESLYFFAYQDSTTALYRVQEDGAGELEITVIADGLYEATDLIVAPALSQAGHPDQLYFVAATPDTMGGTVFRCDGVSAPVPVSLTDNEFGAEAESLSVGDGRLVMQTKDEGIWVASATDDSMTLLADGILVGTTADFICYAVLDDFFPKSVEIYSVRADGTGRTFLMNTPRVYSRAKKQILSRSDTLLFSFSLADQPLQEIWITRGTPETTRPITGLLSGAPVDASLHGKTVYLGAQAARPENNIALGQELYAFDLPPAAGIEFAQIIGGTPARPLNDGDTLAPLVQAVGQSRTVTLQITNTTLRTLSNVNLSVPVPALADFTFDVTSLGDLAPGQTAQVQITFTPAAAGLQEGKFTVSASGRPDIELELSGAGLSGDSPPAIGFLPPLLFMAAGDPLLLKPDYLVPGSSPRYFWRKSNKTVGIGPEVNLSPVGITSAGSYNLQVVNANGMARSSSTFLAVFQPLPAISRVAEGGNLTLHCQTSAPAGSCRSFQWLYNGLPLSETTRFRGTRTPTLKLIGISAANDGPGTYTCQVTLDWEGLSIQRSTSTQVRVVGRPEWVAFDPSSVGFQVSLLGQQISTHPVEFQDADKVTAKGLPPGLTFNATTGRVEGRPTKVGLYNVTFTATNPAGSTLKLLKMEVRPAVVPGGYDGLLDRTPATGDTPGLGSRVLFTITTAGTVSGQLFHEGKVLRFAGMPVPLQEEIDPNGTVPVTIQVSRGKNQPGITLTFKTRSTESSFTLADARTSTQMTGDLRSSVTFSAQEATLYTGPACILLKGQAPAEDESEGEAEAESGAGLPGAGYISAIVSRTGTVIWKGKLADGTAITGSHSLTRSIGSPSLHFAIHQDLYKATGSLHGWVRMNTYSDRPILIDGALSWNKPAQPGSKDRLYTEGIPLHTLGASGGSYTPPAEDEFILNLPPLEGDPGNAEGKIVITADSLPGLTRTLSQRFKVNLKHKATPLPATQDTFLTSLTFNAAQGTFKGSLRLPHTHPKLTRTATFEGVINPATANESAGFFLLPDLPAENEPVSALKTTPIRSGYIQIAP